MYVSDLSVKEGELLFEVNTEMETPVVDHRTLLQIDDLKDMKKVLRYPFNVQLELSFIVSSIIKRPDVQIYRVTHIYTRRALDEINSYACEYRHALLVKPMLSNPFQFEGYLFCYGRRRLKITDRQIANNTLKLQRFILTLVAWAEIWLDAMGTRIEQMLMRNPSLLNSGLIDMFTKR